MTPEQLQALLALADKDSNSDISQLIAGASGGKPGSFSNTANLSVLTGKEMAPNKWMALAGLAGAAIPFVQGARLGREVKRYKPTNLVPQQAYDVVQNLSQELNAPVTNYGQRMQELNDARAARMAYSKKAGTSSDFLRALYASEDMYNKGLRQLGMEGSAERLGRRKAYNAALANLGAQEAASAQKNREALAALKQARDLNYAKSGEGLINSLINSVVLKPDKNKKGGENPDYTDFFSDFVAQQGDSQNPYQQKGGSYKNFLNQLLQTYVANKAGSAKMDNAYSGASPANSTYQMKTPYGKPKIYNPQFSLDPALTPNNSLYPFIKP